MHPATTVGRAVPAGPMPLFAGKPAGPPPCDRCGRPAEKLYFVAGSLLCASCDLKRPGGGIRLETK